MVAVHARRARSAPVSEEINDEVVRRMLDRYRAALPLVPGAVEAVRALAGTFPLAVASSSNRPLIDAVLDTAGISDCFAATVSSEEVARGKPSPDVYLEAARRLGTIPAGCAAVEDSANGMRAAHAAGMSLIAFPTRITRRRRKRSPSRTSSLPRWTSSRRSRSRSSRGAAVKRREQGDAGTTGLRAGLRGSRGHSTPSGELDSGSPASSHGEWS